jgi:hypothetical protein
MRELMLIIAFLALAIALPPYARQPLILPTKPMPAVSVTDR